MDSYDYDYNWNGKVYWFIFSTAMMTNKSCPRTVLWRLLFHSLPDCGQGCVHIFSIDLKDGREEGHCLAMGNKKTIEEKGTANIKPTSSVSVNKSEHPCNYVAV